MRKRFVVASRRNDQVPGVAEENYGTLLWIQASAAKKIRNALFRAITQRVVGNSLPTFRDNLSVPTSRFRNQRRKTQKYYRLNQLDRVQGITHNSRPWRLYNWWGFFVECLFLSGKLDQYRGKTGSRDNGGSQIQLKETCPALLPLTLCQRLTTDMVSHVQLLKGSQVQ